jgi:hypothetical protein
MKPASNEEPPMRTYDDHALFLPPEAIANHAFAHQDRIDAARRFLAARGITEVRPVYGHRARPLTAASSVARVAIRPAANDVATSGDATATATAA